MNTSHLTFTDHLAHLRANPQAVAHGAAAAGTRVIGHVGEDIAVALILAAGALPVRLRGKPDHDTSAVEDLVESSFSTELRVIAAQWLAGDFDHLEAVVFPRSDDSAQRLYYYLCELQRRGLCRGPRPLLYDIANLPRAASLEHTVDSTRRLATQLGASAEALDSSLQRVARRAAALQTLRDQRLQASPPPGSHCWAIEFASACDWREAFDVQLASWLADPPSLTTPRRVLLAGSPLPDEGLHRAVEDCGASVVRELTAWHDPGGSTQGDAFARLAAEFQRRLSPALAMRCDPRWLAESAKRADAPAVIVWLSEEDEALPWEIARQLRALRDSGVPTLLLARQPWRVDATTVDHVQNFLRNPGTAA